MAAGEAVVFAFEAQPPNAADAAVPATRVGTSSPAENFQAWEFVDAGTRYMDYKCWVSPAYAGGKIRFIFPWFALAATTGAAHWEIAIRRLHDDQEDLDAAHTYDYNTVNDTTASAAGEFSYAQIDFEPGADMDSLAAGEWILLRIRRVPGDASDNLGESAFLWDIVGIEIS